MSVRAAVDSARNRRNHYNRRPSGGYNLIRRSQYDYTRDCHSDVVCPKHGCEAPIPDPGQRTAAMAARLRLDEKLLGSSLTSSSTSALASKSAGAIKHSSDVASATSRQSLSNLFNAMLMGFTCYTDVKISSRYSPNIATYNKKSISNNNMDLSNDHLHSSMKNDANIGCNAFTCTVHYVRNSLSLRQNKHSRKAYDHEQPISEIKIKEGGVVQCSNLTSKECSVCLDAFLSGQLMVCLPCDHLFHKGCIIPWLHVGHHHCPFCRAKITPITANT